MSLFDRLVASSLPFVPKPVVRAVSRRYIAGPRLEDGLRVVRELNADGARATLDVLGEDVTERAQAEATVVEYERAVESIVEHGLDCNLSIKLTALGLRIDERLCTDLVDRLLDHAERHGLFVRIDMEDSSVTQATLDLYREVRSRHRNVGPVLQAYLRRTLADARSLISFCAEIGDRLNVRLCKGIYDEPYEVAFKDRDVIRRSYQNLLEVLLDSGAYVGIATHDELLVYEGLRLVDRLGLGAERYEFQMLLGVTSRLRRLLVEAGHPLRVYVPYGSNWYGYSIRRLKENPKIAGYVFRALFER